MHAENNRNAPGHRSNSHMTMMRHMRKKPSGVGMHVGRFDVTPQQYRRQVKKHPPSVVSGVQRALSAVGFGGLAHPVRRLHHPGGSMAIPGVGRGAVETALSKATVGEEASGTVPAGLHAAYQALQKSERAKDVAASGIAAAGVGGAYAGGFALAGAPLWRRSSWSGSWWGPDSTAGPSGPSKRQVQNQRARDLATKQAFKQDVAWLVRSGQLPRSQQPRSFAWADRQYGRTEVANARNYIRDNYRPPPGGWVKAP